MRDKAMKQRPDREGRWELLACLVVVVVAAVAYFVYDPYVLARLVCTPDCL